MRASEETLKGTQEPPKPTTSTVVLLLGTIADTTWRMFVPIISMMLLGLWADQTLNTLPWFFIAGIVTGIAVATELVRRQFNTVKK